MGGGVVPLFNLAPDLTVSKLCLGWLSFIIIIIILITRMYVLMYYESSGTMTFGEQNTLCQSFRLLDQAFDAGINFFDSAEM